MCSDTSQLAKMAANTVIFIRIDSFHGVLRLTPGMLDAENVEFSVGNTHTAKLVTVAA